MLYSPCLENYWLHEALVCSHGSAKISLELVNGLAVKGSRGQGIVVLILDPEAYKGASINSL